MASHNRSALRKGAITPRDLTIHLTLQCPLKCSHCCVSSDMHKKGHLDLASVLRLIDEAATFSTIEMIHFVGGDPFLHQDILEAAFRHIAGKGLLSAAVTSAYWATSPEKADRILKTLTDAGLNQLTISYDDQHAEFVSEEKIVFAYRAATALGITTLISIVADPAARINKAYMQRLLGSEANITEAAVNSTGRALEEATAELLESRRTNELAYRGPCKSMLRQISVHENGALTPCCGVIPMRDGLRFGDIHRDSLDAAVNRAFNNPVYKWIAFEGPVAILRQITASTERPLRDEDFDGICHACDVLFTTPEYLQLLTEALPLKEPSLQLQEAVSSSIGLFQMPVTNGSGAKVERHRQLPVLQGQRLEGSV